MGASGDWEIARVGDYAFSYSIADLKPDIDAKVEIAVGEPSRYDSQPWEDYIETYRNQVLSRQLLDTLSPAQLRLLKNTFYALHGRSFRDPGLAAYFDKRSVKRYGWYVPRADFKDSDLSPVERENVELIAAYEKGLVKTLTGRSR